MADNSSKRKQPQRGHYDNIGHYQHDLEVFIDSKHTLRLVGGRKANPKATEKWAQHEVIGLVKYAPAVIRLYRMAHKDNPYVDEALVKLEMRIEEAEEFFKEKIATLKVLLSNLPANTELKVVKSTKPFHLKPNFGGNPYANKGVLLLAAYDQMMTLMETCRSSALIKRRQANDIEYHGGRAIRRVFVCPGEFSPCEVTRSDIMEKTSAALKILEGRGEPDQEVFHKRVLPEFGPRSDDFDDTEIEEILSAIENLGTGNAE